MFCTSGRRCLDAGERATRQSSSTHSVATRACVVAASASDAGRDGGREMAQLEPTGGRLPPILAVGDGNVPEIILNDTVNVLPTAISILVI